MSRGAGASNPNPTSRTNRVPSSRRHIETCAPVSVTRRGGHNVEITRRDDELREILVSSGSSTVQIVSKASLS
jgi:hypothetical protein